MKSKLSEASPDPSRVDTSIIMNELTDAVADMGMDMADSVVFNFRKKIVRHIAGLMNSHAMSSIKIDPRSFDDELEDFDPDEVMELSQECMSDITFALEKYAKALGELAVHMAGGEGPQE